MACRYRVYPELKDSNVEWLGQIPVHWELIRGKFRFFNKKEVNKELQCMERLALTMNGVIERSIESDDGLQPAEFSGYQIFEKDDLVFKLIDLENYKTSRVGLVHKKGIMSPAYIRATPYKDVNSKYFYYFYFDLYLRGIYNDIGGQGVRSALNASELLDMFICSPSAEEQQAIANFLDHETAKIDTLIEKQQQLIALLKEKRQAVISHAVTKGLNLNAKMKDSGVEWLGEVPKHWGIGKIKYLSSVISKGTTPSTVGSDFETAGIRFLKAENIGKGFYVAPEPAFYISKNTDEQLARSRLNDRDVLVIIAGATTGLSSVMTPELLPANTNQAVSFIRPSKKVYSEYISYWLSTAYAQSNIWQGAVQAAQPNLSMETLGNIFIPIPPENEVESLISDIDKRLSQFAILISNAELAIQLIQERRTALISAAVTGKIDLRDWQAPKENQTNREVAV